MESRLSKVSKGRLNDPHRYVLYGPEGAGKTTLAADAPAPIWLDIENGSGQLDVARYQFRDGPGGHVPQSYAEVLSAIDDLTANAHAHKTLVIDTVDRLEAMLWSWMIDRDNDAGGLRVKLTNVESYGYGKGYTAALDEWRALALRLDRLRAARGMSIVLLAHAQVKTFKNPEGEDYDRYQLQLEQKASGFLKGWADVTGFLTFEDVAGKLAKGERARGVSTGRRILRLAHSAAYDAKSRYTMPEEVEIPAVGPWSIFGAAVDAAGNMAPDELRALIAAEVTRLSDPGLTPRVEKAVREARNDTASLHRFLQSLKSKQPKEGAAS